MSHYVSTHVLLCCSVSLCVVCHVTVCVCVCHSSLAVGPYEELIASHGIVEEYFAFDATLVLVLPVQSPNVYIQG